jgi:hypothetical protein
MIGGWGAIPEKTIALVFPIDPFRKQETSDKIHETYKDHGQRLTRAVL